jgi:hypothetical protein
VFSLPLSMVTTMVVPQSAPSARAAVIIRSASAAAARKRRERGGVREAGDRGALDPAVFVLAGLGELDHSSW